MKALVAYASESSGLRRLMQRVTEFEQTQGVVLDYDPLWLALWHIRHRRGDHAAERWLNLYWDRMRYWSPWPPQWQEMDPGLFWMSGDLDMGESFPPPDPWWSPPGWKELCNEFGWNPDPIIVKVATDRQMDERELFGDDEYGLRVMQSVRQRARLHMPKRRRRPLQGGVSIGSGPLDSGTLGGIVIDQNQDRWGITCSHVFGNGNGIDQPARIDSCLRAAKIGKNTHLSALLPSSANVPCNPYNKVAKMNSVDAALIGIDSAVTSQMSLLNVGPLHGVMPMGGINTGDLMDVAGKECGHRVLSVGGLALTYRFFDGQGTAYCFKDVFELRWPKNVRLLLGRPILPGDSGSWAASVNTSEWAGMVMGGDRLRGYAMFADNVIQWAKHSHSLDLSVT